MKDWFDSLQPREKQLLLSAAAIIALLVIYSLIWRPLVGKLEQTRAALVTERQNLNMIKTLQAQAKQLQASAQAKKGNALDGSLLKVVDSTRESAQLPAAKRIEPEGKNSIRIWIEEVPFDKLMMWIGRLQRQYHIEVSDLLIDKQKPGIVNAKIIFLGPAT